MDQETKSLNEILDILKRRKLVFILTAIPIIVIAIAVAILWPPAYKSSATILIEEQEIPREFVATTVTSYAEQRLQSISQVIMSTTRLLEIINRFNLYEDMRKRATVEAAVEQMRKDIKFETISAEGKDPRSGKQGAVTIAFTVSYEGRNPKTVQEVATVLSSLYLQENLSQREQQTAGVSKFLQDETKILQEQLIDLNSKIANFKGRYVGALPELLQTNLQGLDRSDRDLVQLKDQLRTLKDKESYLIIQLSSIPTTGTANADKLLLKELRAKLAQFKSKYSEQHPDVIKTKREIEELEGRIEKTSGEGPGKGKSDFIPSEQSDNEAYVTLASQLASTRSDIQSVQRQLIEAEKKRNEYQRRIEASPKVDETYKTLLLERNNIQAKYDDLTRKSMEAKVAQGLEKGQMGERFTLIDPARLPGKPIKPNRLAIILIGFILGIGAGVGMMVLQEAFDHSVKDSRTLSALTGVPVLGTIPNIVTTKDIIERKKRNRTIAISVAAVVVVAILLVHFLFQDFTILWARLARRFP
jgi:polysaccharide chain length determinant protein (PEP-CTERM system associated)